MKKIMLFYPPGPLFQRGEDRCQANIDESVATTIRACNDLGYASSLLTRAGHEVFLMDYQTEGLSIEKLIEDFNFFKPDVVFVSITNATIFQDLKIIKVLKQNYKDFVVVLKGAIFFHPEKALLDQLDLSEVDYLVGGESDFIMDKLVDAHFSDRAMLSSIGGILFKENGEWQKTSFSCWEKDLDAYPFPDRGRMNNLLYTRPDTDEMQATITTSRGCPASCIYCMTPIISGKPLRLRSPENIFQEIRECYEKYYIKNFFFKSDTFTMNPVWVKELCEKILSSDLNGKVEWAANSRVKPICQETLDIMKAAGCWLIAFGYESGSQETLLKIKKGTTLEDNFKAAQMAKKAGLNVFGFFLIGLPWEKQSNLSETRKHMFELNPDFVELHIALPFYGTPLYDIAKAEGLIDETTLGKDYFQAPTIGTKYLSIEEIQSFRDKTLRDYHLRPSYIVKKLLSQLSRPRVLKNYFKYGWKLLTHTC